MVKKPTGNLTLGILVIVGAIRGGLLLETGELLWLYQPLGLATGTQ
jgi:hypothetical protein